jgi:hypothetical protein
LTTNKDILFTGPNPTISFFSGATLSVPHGTTKAFDLTWSRSGHGISPAVSTSNTAVVITTKETHLFSDGDAILLTNILFDGNSETNFQGRESYIRVLSKRQFELPRVHGDNMEGIGGAVGHIDNTLVMHIASITSANPAQVTTFHPHNLNTNDLIIVTDVLGMTKINRQIYSIKTTDNDFSFTLNNYPDTDSPTSSTEWDPYIEDGRVIKINHNASYKYIKIEIDSNNNKIMNLAFETTIQNITEGDIVTFFINEKALSSRNGQRFIVSNISDDGKEVNIVSATYNTTSSDGCGGISSNCTGSIFKISDNTLMLAEGITFAPDRKLHIFFTPTRFPTRRCTV